MCASWYSDRKGLGEHVTSGKLKPLCLNFSIFSSLRINSFISQDDRLLFSRRSWKAHEMIETISSVLGRKCSTHNLYFYGDTNCWSHYGKIILFKLTEFVPCCNMFKAAPSDENILQPSLQWISNDVWILRKSYLQSLQWCPMNNKHVFLAINFSWSVGPSMFIDCFPPNGIWFCHFHHLIAEFNQGFHGSLKSLKKSYFALHIFKALKRS